MPRNMSFTLTIEQVQNRRKTVTRRCGWWFLESGDIVNAVEKGMGLRKGEKVKRICQIRIVSAGPEPLAAITDADVVREGFPGRSREWFLEMFCRHNRCRPDQVVNRIAFEYV